jgi:hypothetical protein
MRPLASDEFDAEATPESFSIADLDPRAQLECLQRIHLVRAALTCFAAQGHVETRQAHLLRRRVLDDVPYRDLALALNGNGRSIGNAVQHGVAALAAKELPEELVPRCMTRSGADAHDVILK